jgi:hypothetical protein
MARDVLIALGVFLALALGAVRAFRGAASAEGPAGRNLVWDFSRSRDVSVVGWPDYYTPDCWFSGLCDTLQIVLPGGRRTTFSRVAAQVFREDGRVRVIVVAFVPESLDAAHARAATLISQWDLGLAGHDALDAWRKRIRTANLDQTGSDQRDFRFNGEYDRFPRVGVHVRWTMHDAAPWSVEWEWMFAGAKR